MFIRTAVVAFLAAAIFACTGCIGRQETDSVAFILALGVDQAGQNLKTTYQIAVAKNLTGGAGSEGADGGDGFLLNSIEALNLAESRNLLGSTMSRIPTASHLKAIIISEDLARKGLEPLLSPLMRFREYRGNIFLIVVQGSAEEFMKMNKPKLEAVPSKFYEGVMFAAEDVGGYFLLTDLHDFYIRLKNHVGSPYMVYATISPKDGISRPAKPKVKPETTEEYKPGGLPRTGNENPAEFIGTALFRGDKMVGSLTSEETRMLAMLQGNFPHGFIVVQDPLEPKQSVNLRSRLGEETQIKCSIRDGRAYYSIKVRLEGELSSIPSGINYETGEYKELMEKQVANMLEYQIRKMLSYTQQIGSDPVGCIAHLRPHFAKYQDMKEADLNKIYSEAEFTLDVKMAIRRSGLMWRTSPVNKPKENE